MKICSNIVSFCKSYSGTLFNVTYISYTFLLPLDQQNKKATAGLNFLNIEWIFIWI